HGVRPTPALVKQLLVSTATDLGAPAYEQGAGLLNTLAAVQAAESWQDANGSPSPQGSALVLDQGQLSLGGDPGATVSAKLAVTNTSDHTQTVTPSTRVLGAPTTAFSGDVALNTATAPTYLDERGNTRSFATQQFTVPAGADRLEVSAAANTGGNTLRITLID